jgi:hypothetical protein
MTKVQEIESAVKSLPAKDLKAFRAWFVAYDEKQWDEKIIRDQKNENSPIAKLARRALIAHRRGKSSPL